MTHPVVAALEAERIKLAELQRQMAAQAGRIEGFEEALRLFEQPESVPVPATPEPEPVEEVKPLHGFTKPIKRQVEQPNCQAVPEASAPPPKRKAGRPPSKESTIQLRENRRRQIAGLLPHSPLIAAEICRKTGIPDNSIQGVLDHPWFIRDPSDLRWRITPQCRQEYFDSSDNDEPTPTHNGDKHE